jgi:hypothetical protein
MLHRDLALAVCGLGIVLVAVALFFAIVRMA